MADVFDLLAGFLWVSAWAQCCHLVATDLVDDNCVR